MFPKCGTKSPSGKISRGLVKNEIPYCNLIKLNESDFLEEGSKNLHFYPPYAGGSLKLGQYLKPWDLNSTLPVKSALHIFTVFLSTQSSFFLWKTPPQKTLNWPLFKSLQYSLWGLKIDRTELPLPLVYIARPLSNLLKVKKNKQQKSPVIYLASIFTLLV